MLPVVLHKSFRVLRLEWWSNSQCTQRYDFVDSDCAQEFKVTQKKKTGKPPVFTGPVLLHQNSERKMFPKFAHCLITEQPLAGIQSYGSDGEKALTDGFKRNFQFAFGLRCFIHFKKIIVRELSERKFNGSSKSDFMLEIRWVTHFIAGVAEQNKNAGCI